MVSQFDHLFGWKDRYNQKKNLWFKTEEREREKYQKRGRKYQSDTVFTTRVDPRVKLCESGNERTLPLSLSPSLLLKIFPEREKKREKNYTREKMTGREIELWRSITDQRMYQRMKQRRKDEMLVSFLCSFSRFISSFLSRHHSPNSLPHLKSLFFLSLPLSLFFSFSLPLAPSIKSLPLSWRNLSLNLVVLSFWN